MKHPITVFKLTRADGALPGWLNSILEPVISSIKSESTPIVEFRPLGRFGGYAMATEGRILLCTQMQWSSKTSVAQLFIHELSHLLLNTVEHGIHHGHNAAFYCLNLVLLRRLDDAKIDTGNSSLHANSMSMYDHQDPILHHCEIDAPESVWRPVEMQWILETADRFRDSPSTAEELAAEIHEAYFVFADQVADDAGKRLQELAAQKKATEQRRTAQRRLEEEKTFFKVGFFLLLAAITAAVYFAL